MKTTYLTARPAVRFALILLSVVPATIALGAAGKAPGKTTWTYPMPPKIKPADPMAVNPGYEVPPDPSRFLWTTTAVVHGKNLNKDGIPVYRFGEDGRRVQIGILPEGTTVQLTTFRRLGRALYYEIPWENSPTGKSRPVAWISGLNIKSTGPAPAE